MEEPFDDPTIDDDDLLIRYILPDQYHAGSDRPESAAFSPSSTDGGISVDLCSVLDSLSLNRLHNFGSRRAGTGACLVRVRAVRALGLAVFRDPIDANPAHAQIINLHENGRITKGVRRKLAVSSCWLMRPDVRSIH